MAIQALNPATGKLIKTYQEVPPNEAREIVRCAHQAQLTWGNTGVRKRAEKLRSLAAILREYKADCARLMALEMGKPVRAGLAEAEKCALVCEHYADEAERYLTPREVETEARKSFVAYEPLGVVLAVLSSQFPFWQAFRVVAPALAAGNTVVLKHASNVPGCALAIENALRKAELPADLLRVLFVAPGQLDRLIGNRLISAVAFSGGRDAGSSVARSAGRHLKKAVVSLGGNDPYVVLADADLEAAADACVTSRLINAGQSSLSAKRLIVVRSLLEPFGELLANRLRIRKVGDPLDPSTEIGPLARHELRDRVHRAVVESVSHGARLILGGEIPEGPGAYYPPTLLLDVAPGMPVFDEEVLGPVVAVVPAVDEAEAIRLANDSQLGLGAAVFTADLRRGERLATRSLQAGLCFVNDFVRSDLRLPFGGIKASGFGRELSQVGLHELVNIKTVWVR